MPRVSSGVATADINNAALAADLLADGAARRGGVVMSTSIITTGTEHRRSSGTGMT